MAHPKGGYKDKNKKKVPGVTGILGRFKDSGGLMFWAFEQGKAAERGEIEKLYDKRDQAADAGTLAHDLVEAHIRKTNPPAIPDNVTGTQAIQGFQNYLTWQENNRIQIVETECELVSEKYLFGGCLDGVGIDSDFNLCILDWKTSNSIYTDMLAQIAAYKVLWEENNPDRPITGGYHLCRFSKEHADFAHHYWGDLDIAWQYFIRCRELYDIDKQLKKRV